MYNTSQKQNLKLLKKLKKEGYTDLGWANDGKEFTKNDENRIEPIQQIDCSKYSKLGDHKVFIDHDNKEILHVDMSD